MTHTRKLLGAALAAVTLVLAACGGGGDDGAAQDAPTTTDPARASECTKLIKRVDPDFSGSKDEVAAQKCRTDGYDPVWNGISIYSAPWAYEAWRDTGDAPTCADIVGHPNPLSSGKYNARDVADCEAMVAGEDLPEREGKFDTAISDAAAKCGVDDAVGDDGDSITLDTKGEEDVAGDDISDVACVLKALDTPDHVISRMDSTRALDGTVDADWGDYSAFWTYHPDNGMKLTIFRQESR